MNTTAVTMSRGIKVLCDMHFWANRHLEWENIEYLLLKPGCGKIVGFFIVNEMKNEGQDGEAGLDEEREWDESDE